MVKDALEPAILISVPFPSIFKHPGLWCTPILASTAWDLSWWIFHLYHLHHSNSLLLSPCFSVAQDKTKYNCIKGKGELNLVLQIFWHKVQVYLKGTNILLSYSWEQKYRVFTTIADLKIVQHHHHNNEPFTVPPVCQVCSQHFVCINAQIHHYNQISRMIIYPFYRQRKMRHLEVKWAAQDYTVHE